MNADFAAAFKEFASNNVNRVVNLFWERYKKINLPDYDRQQWCVEAQYGLNLQNIFEAIEEGHWDMVDREIEILNSYV